MSGPAMLLQQAARHARFAAAAGWPEVLTPGELAALQYPHDDTPEGKKRARVQQRDFYTLAASAIKAGELAAESAQREKSVYQKALEVRSSRDPWISSLASDEWLGRDFGGGRMRTVLKPVKETIEVQALRPVSVAAWLARISEQPSRFVCAWLLANGAASEKVGAGGTAADDAGERRADAIQSMRGVKREILEHWDGIKLLHGPDADVAQVARYLSGKRDSSAKKPKRKTISNGLSDLRAAGLIP